MIGLRALARAAAALGGPGASGGTHAHALTHTPGRAWSSLSTAAAAVPALDEKVLERTLRRVNRRTRLAETSWPPAAEGHRGRQPVPEPHLAGSVAGATHSLIFLHGFGDTGNGWVEVAQILVDGLEGSRVVVPTAPAQKISRLGDSVMHSWFEPRSFGRPWATENVQEQWTCNGHEESTRIVEELVQRETDLFNIPRERIFLGGFSQGAALALAAGLQVNPKGRLGGILVFSGYLPRCSTYSRHSERYSTMQTALCPKTVQTPIVLFHGDEDPIVPPVWAEEAKRDLEGAGFQQVDLHVFEAMRHELCSSQIHLARQWMAAAVQR